MERESSKRIIVAKFGGSSLADSERIVKAAKTVAKEIKRGNKVVIVTSAIGRTTDELIRLLEKTSNESIEKMDLDDVLSMGERTSARVFAAALKSQGFKVRYFDPSDQDWPIITDSNFLNANPILDECEKRIKESILPLLKDGTIPIIGGFIGKTRDGKVSTIGRGGSDTTAFLIARALGADEVVLVTDSDGIMNADPKIVPKAKKLDRIDVNTLVGLADSGSKFIHRKALKYKHPSIQARVINFRHEDLSSPGTIITGGLPTELEISLAKDSSILSITIVGSELNKNPRIIEELISNIESSSSLFGFSGNQNSIICYVIKNETYPKLLEKIHELVMNYEEAIAMSVKDDLAFIKVKGVGLEETPGIIGKMSETLRLNNINIFGILTITSSILIFVKWEERIKALELMKKALGG
ncbi:MAG: aspartate kinase [Candidatus Bathyarchaeia archaeon]